MKGGYCAHTLMLIGPIYILLRILPIPSRVCVQHAVYLCSSIDLNAIPMFIRRERCRRRGYSRESRLGTAGYFGSRIGSHILLLFGQPINAARSMRSLWLVRYGQPEYSSTP